MYIFIYSWKHVYVRITIKAKNVKTVIWNKFSDNFSRKYLNTYHRWTFMRDVVCVAQSSLKLQWDDKDWTVMRYNIKIKIKI